MLGIVMMRSEARRKIWRMSTVKGSLSINLRQELARRYTRNRWFSSMPKMMRRRTMMITRMKKKKTRMKRTMYVIQLNRSINLL